MKAKKLDANPRKTPVQARSLETVDAILTAAAQVLAQHGYDETTTARIAARAGVSVGTLYQYFPNKQALVAALLERSASELVQTVRVILRDPARASLEDCLRAVIDATVMSERLDPRLHKIFQEQVVTVGKVESAARANSALRSELEACLRAHAAEIHPAHDATTAATVIEAVLGAITHKLVVEQGVLSGRVAASQAFAVVMSYLRQAPPK